MNAWKTVSSKIAYQNPRFRVREDEVTKPDGTNGIFYVIEQPDSVMIVPLTKHNEVYLIGLYRYATKRFSWEIPGGAMEDNNIIGNAKKELQEETGLISDDWSDLGIYQAMNGCVNKTGHILLAKNVVQTNTNKQKEEGITEMKIIPFHQAIDMIKKGEITDSHTITALFVAGLKLGLVTV